MSKATVYEIVTERIIAALEKGVVPWQMPWRTSGGGMPKNLISKKDYRGVNIFLLGAQGYASPWWLTFNQAKAKCGKDGGVRKGEKGTPVIFWKVLDKKGGKPGEKSFILRYYTVFNASQVDGLELPESTEAPALTFNPIEQCEKIVRSYKTVPAIDHGGSRAYYIPSFDRICMPEKDTFNGVEEYYSTLFHELTHSTGHEDRLKRDGIMNPIQFGSHEYSFEELVAECGSAFLCAQAGILDHTLDNSAAYIANWVKKLKSEPKWVVEAASKAAKAADYIYPPPAVVKEEEDKVAA